MSSADEWMAAMKAKGHTPVVDDRGRLEFFVHDAGFHNGPGCEACGWSTCWHCDETTDIPECTKPALLIEATKSVAHGVDAVQATEG